MGWSVPVLEKGSWAMAQVFISVGTWRYNYNLQPLQSLRPTLPSLLDWLSDVGACITLDIHILRSCSETSLLIHCKVPLIADICKLILQTYQTSDNNSLHASHFSSWSLFFSTQCCYCAKTLSAAAYREVWIHSNQQHNGPMCWHLASCESRAKQEGLWPCQCDSMNLEHIHCGKPNNLHLITVTPNTSSENHFLKTLFSMLCKNWRGASGPLFWQSITSHRWGLNKHRIVLFGLDSCPAGTWLLRKTRADDMAHKWKDWW